MGYFRVTIRLTNVGKIASILFVWLSVNPGEAQSIYGCNTTVRFNIRYGTTPVGAIDVELFDFEKPLTVSNFLHQVETGLYEKSFLHRLETNSLIQGGLYSIENPNVSTPATDISTIPSTSSIKSELNFVRRISNSFGTLAMALTVTNVGTNYYPQQHSATTSWFFNLGDNSATFDDHYTVFGQAISGYELLRYFNTFAEGAGIINMFSLDYLFSPCDLLSIDGNPNYGLSRLPVAYFYFDCPYYSDLFTTHIEVVSRSEDTICLHGPTRVLETLKWSFATKRGFTYEVQYTEDPNSETWKILRTFIGDGSTKAFTVSKDAKARFFRLQRR